MISNQSFKATRQHMNFTADKGKVIHNGRNNPAKEAHADRF